MFAHQKKVKLLDQSAAAKETGRFLPARDLSLFFGAYHPGSSADVPHGFIKRNPEMLQPHRHKSRVTRLFIVSSSVAICAKLNGVERTGT